MSETAHPRDEVDSQEASFASLCEYLDWDSQFFGRRIARARSGSLTVDTARALLDACVDHQIECVYLLADAADVSTVRILEERGFRLVDVRVSLERQGWVSLHGPVNSDLTVRSARNEDMAHLKAMARVGFRMTRFYADPHFPESRVDALYETWIEKSCNGYADEVMVVEVDGVPAGYVSCHLRGGHIGQIGLLGVRGDLRDRGLGRVLTNAATEWFASRGATTVRVVTQGRNRGALRVYQRCGFVIDAIQLWYHRWWLKEGCHDSE